MLISREHPDQRQFPCQPEDKSSYRAATTEQQRYRATKLQSSNAVEQQTYRAAMLQSSKATE